MVTWVGWLLTCCHVVFVWKVYTDVLHCLFVLVDPVRLTGRKIPISNGRCRQPIRFSAYGFWELENEGGGETTTDSLRNAMGFLAVN